MLLCIFRDATLSPMTSQDSAPQDAIETAARHLSDILSIAIGYTESQSAVIVFDRQCPLATILAEAYRRCLPRAVLIDFDSVTPESILASFSRLAPSDLAVLIQSTNFRLEAFRVRVELFKRSIKVIEHPHLSGIRGPAEISRYLDSLAYDSLYYRGTGTALKERIDRAKSGVIDSGGGQLLFEGGFEPAKLNTGDYSRMANVGGQFPIGEVFTEARDLEAVNGRVRIFAFGDTSFTLNKPDKPITLEISRGRVAGVLNSTPEFDQVLANIRADEEEVWIRELGFGLNRAFTQTRTVSDIGTYERMCGIHLSLGAKHAIFKKPHFTRSQARHHVDVFAVTESVTLDDVIVYREGAWKV